MGLGGTCPSLLSLVHPPGMAPRGWLLLALTPTIPTHYSLAHFQQRLGRTRTFLTPSLPNPSSLSFPVNSPNRLNFAQISVFFGIHPEWKKDALGRRKGKFVSPPKVFRAPNSSAPSGCIFSSAAVTSPLQSHSHRPLNRCKVVFSKRMGGIRGRNHSSPHGRTTHPLPLSSSSADCCPCSPPFQLFFAFCSLFSPHFHFPISSSSIFRHQFDHFFYFFPKPSSLRPNFPIDCVLSF